MPKKAQKKPILKLPKKRQQNQLTNLFFYALLLFGLFVFMGGLDNLSKPESVPISQVLQLISEDKVQDVKVTGDELEVTLQDGTSLNSHKESMVSFDEMLANNNVDRAKIAGEIKVERSVNFIDSIMPILIIGLPILVVWFLLRQMRGASGDIMSFGKSRARVVHKGMSKITFDDVAGAGEAKREMVELVDFLKNPKKYQELGARIPKGVLLVGPAGVGKTLLAKAIAGEAKVPFFSVAGSEFMEMLVGVGSARARDLFEKARQAQPSLIFIDEIDAIGRQRGMGIGGGHDEREQTLNQILIEMDGFDTRTSVIVIAATNRPDMLDPALIRPGRFDRRITIPLPDIEDRKAIIQVHMRGKPFDKDIDLEKIARKTVQFSGADIENMLNEAAILAARDGRKLINMDDIEEASLKVTMGSERRIIQTEEEKLATAYHEAGHAIVATFVDEMDPVYRVSIVARGGSLGHTSFPPERDIYNMTETRLRSRIAAMLGGRAAEEVVYNQFTIGASNDIEQATDTAKGMVVKYGMSELGPINFNGDDQTQMLAMELGHHSKPFSEETARRIDEAIKKIIDTAYTTAKQILVEKRDLLDALAKRLLEKETILSDEYKELCLNYSKT